MPTRLAMMMVLGLGTSLLAPASALAAEPALITISHVRDHVFAVEVAAADGRGGVDISWRPGEGTADGTADFVGEMVFVLPDGSEQDATYEGQGHWRPAAGEQTAWRSFRYRLTADHDRAIWDIGKEEVAYRFDDGFYFIGDSVLALPLSWADREFRIRFDLPADWTSVAVWPRGSDGLYRAGNLQDLWRNIFVVGPDLEPQTSRVGDLEVILLAEKVFADARPAFAGVLESSLASYSGIFGGVPMDRYLVVFGAGAMNDGGAFSQSFGQRLPAPFRPEETLMWARTLAHETLHAWLGIAIRPEPRPAMQWFTEGGADYLTMKTLYRNEIVTADDVIFMIEGQIRRFFLGRSTSGAIGIGEAGQNKQQNRMLVYGAGALFHYLLDARMTALHGPGAYEAALGGLYGDGGQTISREQLMAHLDAASDGAASAIFADLDGPFDPWGMLEDLNGTGLAVAAFGLDEILVRFAADGCAGSRDAACMPPFLRR